MGSVPEEVLAGIYERMAQDIAEGKYAFEDAACPIRVFEDSTHDPRKIDGLSRGRPIKVTHGVVLRFCFAPIGSTTGPVVAIRLRVLPRGSSLASSLATLLWLLRQEA